MNKAPFITNIAITSILSLVCIIPYFYIRILKLKNKGFHLLMFSLSLFACLSFIISEVFEAMDGGDYSITFRDKCYIIKSIFLGFSFLSDDIAHSIFAVKYWVLSQKISQI